MLRNYFKIAFRNLLRHKAFSLINILGLAVGMGCSILILLWVQNEKSYDRFHAHADQIYRITVKATDDFQAAVNPAGMPAELKARMPVIRNTVRLSHSVSSVFEVGDKKVEEKNGFYADTTFFQVFSFPLIMGDIRSVLSGPGNIVLSESMAKKYFGDVSPIGKTIHLNNESEKLVTGVFADIPENSHLRFDYLMPMTAIVATDNDLVTNTWDNFNFYSYLLLDDHFKASPENLRALDRQISAINKEHAPGSTMSFQLQPLTKIHLYSNYQVDLPGQGSAQYVKIFFIVAVFILIVACINFMNLATARSERRAKEVGLRKVVGARRAQLIAQFLGEALLIAFIALCTALLFVYLALPAFNNLAGKALSLHLLDKGFIGYLIVITLATGLLAGSYPAFLLSGFQPVPILKGVIQRAGGNFMFRNILVIIQFTVSIILLIGTIVAYRQLNFIKNMNLGFDKENLVTVPLSGELWNKRELYKDMLRQNPLTSDFTLAGDLPVNLTTGSLDVNWTGKDPRSRIVIPTLAVDERFADVFKVRFLSGRNFQPGLKTDTAGYIINETFAGLMGLNAATAVGKPLTLWGRTGTIIGVTKDFNFKPLQQKIEPVIMRLNTYGGSMVIRTKPGAVEPTLSILNKINTALNPAFPFSYSFIDQDLDKVYESEQRAGQLFNLFAVLGVFVACLGLYGLSAFMAEQRKKEIGVRKVLGASSWSVVLLLSKSFTRLIFIALLIALPFAWYTLTLWLNGFAYRVQIGGLVFALTAAITLLVAWITVGYESARAAIANPVKALRSE